MRNDIRNLPESQHYFGLRLRIGYGSDHLREENMATRCVYEGCGRAFEPKRADARYCSAQCRARASKGRREPGSEGLGAGGRPRPGEDSAGEGGQPSLVRASSELAQAIRHPGGTNHPAQALTQPRMDTHGQQGQRAAAPPGRADAELRERLLSLEEGVSRARERSKKAVEMAQGLEARLASLSQAPDPNARALVRAQERLQGIEGRVAELERRTTPRPVSTGDQEVRSAVTRLARDHREMLGRLDTLEDALTRLVNALG